MEFGTRFTAQALNGITDNPIYDSPKYEPQDSPVSKPKSTKLSKTVLKTTQEQPFDKERDDVSKQRAAKKKTPNIMQTTEEQQKPTRTKQSDMETLSLDSTLAQGDNDDQNEDGSDFKHVEREQNKNKEIAKPHPRVSKEASGRTKTDSIPTKPSRTQEKERDPRSTARMAPQPRKDVHQNGHDDEKSETTYARNNKEDVDSTPEKSKTQKFDDKKDSDSRRKQETNRKRDDKEKEESKPKKDTTRKRNREEDTDEILVNEQDKQKNSIRSKDENTSRRNMQKRKDEEEEEKAQELNPVSAPRKQQTQQDDADNDDDDNDETFQNPDRVEDVFAKAQQEEEHESEKTAVIKQPTRKRVTKNNSTVVQKGQGPHTEDIAAKLTTLTALYKDLCAALKIGHGITTERSKIISKAREIFDQLESSPS